MTVAKLEVTGMVCDGCAETVAKLVKELNGVHKAEIVFDTASASIDYDPNHVTIDRIQQVVKEAGFGVKQLTQASA